MEKPSRIEKKSCYFRNNVIINPHIYQLFSDLLTRFLYSTRRLVFDHFWSIDLRGFFSSF